MFDVLIIGAGPSGLTAAIYAARNNLKVGIFEGNVPGGALVITATVENYPGFKKIDGPDLAYSMFEQAMNLGVEFFGFSVKEVRKNQDHFTVIGDEEVEGKTVIIATGTARKKLEIPGENEFTARGISWCAICDGALYRGKDVAVVGGGNSALEESIYLANLAKTVYLIHRRSEFRAESYILDQVNSLPNVKMILDSKILEFQGRDSLESVRLLNMKTNEETTLSINGCFEFIGQIPATEFVKELGITDEFGFIPVNEKFETKIKGLYASGDVIAKDIRQIVTAVNDGAIAALNAIKNCR
jgi:thioredoxin reductase (NADPH)